MKITLFQPDIAQNLGAIMRLGACFDVPIEIIEPCGFPLTTKALRRTAMDYGAAADITRHKSWESFIDSPRAGRLVLFTTKGATRLDTFDFRQNDTLLFGRESAGVPDTVHAAAEARVIIPLSAGMRSFNLATSAAIGLYEALRQTRQLPKDSA